MEPKPSALDHCVSLCLPTALLEEWNTERNSKVLSLKPERAHIPEINIPPSKSFRTYTLETLYPASPQKMIRTDPVVPHIPAKISWCQKGEPLQLAMPGLTSLYDPLYLLICSNPELPMYTPWILPSWAVHSPITSTSLHISLPPYFNLTLAAPKNLTFPPLPAVFSLTPGMPQGQVVE